MSRLPQPGADENIWGDILNDWLKVSHNPDGTFIAEKLPSTVVDGSVTPAKLTQSYIQASQKATPGGVATLDGTAHIPLTQIPTGYSSPDATTASKGIVQIAGDLAGTAAAPTVPGLSGRYAKPAGGIPESDLAADIQLKLNNGASIADATTTSKGIVQLAGHLGGTAAAPSVPSLGSYAPLTQKGVAFGIATLDAGGLVPATQLPGTFSPDATGTTKGILRLTNHLGGTASNPTVPGLSAKAVEGATLHLFGAETVTGAKTFTNPIEVPSPTNPPDTVNRQYVDTIIASTSTPDATTTAKGLVQLAGDLAGTATAPTVPGKISVSQKGVANGVASLDGGGKLPTSQLPAMGRIQPFYSSGLLMTEAGVHRLYNDTSLPWSIVSVRASVGVAPVGNSIIVDLNIDGVTVFTTQANRPTIAAGANASAKVTNMNVTTVAPGSYLTVDVDQVGSTTTGSDLTVQVEIA